MNIIFLINSGLHTIPYCCMYPMVHFFNRSLQHLKLALNLHKNDNSNCRIINSLFTYFT